MLKLFKKLLVPVAALTVAAIVAGCGGPAAGLPKDPSQFTDQNIRDIVAAAVDNTLQVSSFTGRYFSSESYSGNGSGMIPAVSTINATMLSDRVSGRARIDLSVGIAPMDASQSSTSPIQMDISAYLYADYLYINTPLVSATPWTKIPVNGSVLDMFSTRLFDNEVHMFDLPASVSYVRSESVNGTECYVIKVIPNKDQVLAMAQRYQPSNTPIDWSKLADISQVFHDVSYTVWIAQDSFRFVKAESHAQADFTSDGPFKDVISGVTITTDGSMYFTNYNESVVITLPEAARNAPDVSTNQVPDLQQ